MAILPLDIAVMLLQKGINPNLAGGQASTGLDIPEVPELPQYLPPIDDGTLSPAMPSLASTLGQDQLSNPPKQSGGVGGKLLSAGLAAGLGALLGGKMGSGAAMTSWTRGDALRRQEEMEKERIEEAKSRSRIAAIMQQAQVDIEREKEKRMQRSQSVAEANTASQMRSRGITDVLNVKKIENLEDPEVTYMDAQGKAVRSRKSQVPAEARIVPESVASAETAAASRNEAAEAERKFRERMAKDKMEFDAEQNKMRNQARESAAVRMAGTRLDGRQTNQINTVNRTMEANETYKRLQKAALGYEGIKSTLDLLDKGGTPGNIDMELLYAWVKSIDDSVVRPSEAEMATAGRSPVQNLQAFFNRIAAKGTLLPEERETIRKIMLGRINALVEPYEVLRKQKIDYLNRTAKMTDAEFFVPDLLEQFPGVVVVKKEAEKLGGKRIK